MKHLEFPLSKDDISNLSPGERVSLSGYIFCGRDSVLPELVKIIRAEEKSPENFSPEILEELRGGGIFHTAVSPAGVGPTSSNKPEIEESIEPLSKFGVKIHLGKGKIKPATVAALKKYRSAYAIIPPVTALLESKTVEKIPVAFSELGMEALYKLKIKNYPAIIAAVNGGSIYEGQS